ncbi:uncharacterized protein V1510DRAFT_448600 [Dipodascopsis tothii]|uniref:uncharacterized protein n=1 Tax=Dipodascopsis tothii TaxID=44089 RepID=UPI0034CE6853
MAAAWLRWRLALRQDEIDYHVGRERRHAGSAGSAKPGLITWSLLHSMRAACSIARTVPGRPPDIRASAPASLAGPATGHACYEVTSAWKAVRMGPTHSSKTATTDEAAAITAGGDSRGRDLRRKRHRSRPIALGQSYAVRTAVGPLRVAASGQSVWSLLQHGLNSTPYETELPTGRYRRVRIPVCRTAAARTHAGSRHVRCGVPAADKRRRGFPSGLPTFDARAPKKNDRPAVNVSALSGNATRSTTGGQWSSARLETATVKLPVVLPYSPAMHYCA